MEKKLKGLAFLVGGLLLALFMAKYVNGIMQIILQEIHDKIANISWEQIKQQFSGANDEIMFEGLMWNLGFFLMWFIFQGIMLSRCKHVVTKIMPLAITIILWILAEYLHSTLGASDFTAYALCYVTIHWMVGSWLCCFIWCIKNLKEKYY